MQGETVNSSWAICSHAIPAPSEAFALHSVHRPPLVGRLAERSWTADAPARRMGDDTRTSTTGRAEAPTLRCRRVTEADLPGVMRLQRATLSVRFTTEWYDELLDDSMPGR